MANYHEKVKDILQKFDEYHNQFYYKYNNDKNWQRMLPSHIKAIDMQYSKDFDCYLKAIYDTLRLWKMDRNGPRGPKMQKFIDFKLSIEPMKDKIYQAKKIDLSKMLNRDWFLLEEIFKGIKIMKSLPKLVGHSKTMAHLIPNVVPPVDRQYTLSYLRGRKDFKYGLDNEWILLKEIISNFFIPIACNPKFAISAHLWISEKEKNPWDTSIPKVIDNLIIGRALALPQEKPK